ncbi:biotin-dependent carboxyltransferase family protein [Muricauda sp. SCSIO 64092]|uniref:5-oxoprolinase subunit C family protein n=1 Tax=Allomuricauda sp. SCSIO 64092 TaxID=2908842 RepID=UPI001FF463B2|nr:biotin-dependent carboxyltransferase family protein [Muricauda sp. SCSIO 64092]UOY06749.1 biotin-dependent carboxyltransferase family protein [Muricauda sp. SCSIO 64092]
MLKVLKSGFYTTVQDKGRFAWKHKGVPVSGTMDDMARHRINTLLENPSDATVLEITMTGPTLLFERRTYICLGGAELSATLNNEPIENYRVYPVAQGDILSYGRLEKGFRGYLGIKEGFVFKNVLGSTSQYIPLTNKQCIKEGDEIEYYPIRSFDPKLTNLKVGDYLENQELRVNPGPEFGILTQKQQEQLFDLKFSVSKENNRMAYQLEEKIEEHSITMLTSATLPGTVQLTPAGKLIVLMKDGQTTGGYPRILQLTKESISILAQKKAGDTIQFIYG